MSASQISNQYTTYPNYSWIFEWIKTRSLLDIAVEYLKVSNYNGECRTSTSGGMFNAFICYKLGQKISRADAIYLNGRSGVISYYDPATGADKDLYVRATIRSLDGPGFDEWFDNLIYKTD